MWVLGLKQLTMSHVQEFKIIAQAHSACMDCFQARISKYVEFNKDYKNMADIYKQINV